MGKASRKKKENKIKEMYSLTDPVVEKVLTAPRLVRGSRLYNELTSDEASSQRVEQATESSLILYHTMHDTDRTKSEIASNMMAKHQFSAYRNNFNRALELGDYETIFIDNQKLFKLLTTSKVPDVDIREFIMENNFPHVVMNFRQYIKEYFGINNIALAIPFIHSFTKQSKAKYDKDYMDVNYLMNNCTVHMMTLLFYVPRECSKYVIHVQMIFIYDEVKKQFVYFDNLVDGAKESFVLDVQMNSGFDIMYLETLLDVRDEKYDLAFGILPCKGVTTRLREAKENEDIYAGEKLTNYSSITKMITTLVINYIMYRSTFPEFIVDGLPQHKVVNPLAKAMEVPNEILESFDSDGSVHSLNNYKDKKCPHYRNGHFRVLNSDYYKAKKFKTIWVKPSFVHKDVFTNIQTAKEDDEEN